MNNTHSHKINCLLAVSLFLLLILTIVNVTFYKNNTSFAITSAKNAITGMSIAITGAPTAEMNTQKISENTEKQIGVYSVLPSFSFPEKQNFVSDYDKLQKQIRDFYKAVQDCQTNNPSETIENCIQDILSQTTYNAWLSESDCETDEERVFYDFTQPISDCAMSEDSDCTCNFPFPKNYPSGNYVFQFAPEGNDLLISLQDSSLTTTLSSLLLLNNGNTLSSETYTLTADDNGATGGFSAASDALYLYKKDDSTVSLEDETTFTTNPVTRNTCTLPKKTTYKFCMQSPTIVSQYDASQQKSIREPLVYVFGINFAQDI